MLEWFGMKANSVSKKVNRLGSELNQLTSEVGYPTSEVPPLTYSLASDLLGRIHTPVYT